MPLFADLSGVPVVRARVTVPWSGNWHADVTLDRVLPAPLVGPQVLTLAGSTWVCAVVRTGDYAGTRMARLVGGAAGWRRPVPSAALPPPLISPIGVPLAVVLGLAAGLALEPPPSLVGYIGSPLLGPSYVFQAGPMALVLQDVLGDSWYMDPASGVVQTAPRLPTPIVSTWAATAADDAAGRIVVATDSPGDWTPGATFLGPVVSGTISRVTHLLESGSLRSEVMVP